MILSPQNIAAIKVYVSTPVFVSHAFFVVFSFVLFIGLYYVKHFAYGFFLKHSKDSRKMVAEFIQRTFTLFLLFLSLQCIVWVMRLEPAFEKFIDQCFVVIFFVQIAVWLEFALTDFALRHFQKHKKAKDLQVAGAFSLIRFAIRISVWATMSMIILNNLGFDVTALITGFGIGGIAIGLASQKILGDLFASLSIVLDKPFSEGDFIVFDAYEGYVEEIGLKSTRIRSTTGEQIVCSNAYLLDSRIKNYQRMRERRNTMYYHLSVENSDAAIKKMEALVRETLEKHQAVRLERLGISKILRDIVFLEAVFWVESPKYRDSAETIYDVNKTIVSKAKSLKIIFAKDYGASE